MKLVWGKFRMWIILTIAKVLCVPIKIRERYLMEQVCGMKYYQTSDEELAAQGK